MSDRPQIPRDWNELTPEQQAALIEIGREFGRRLAEHMQAIRNAWTSIAAACAEAGRQIEEQRATEPALPAAVGSAVLVRGMGGNRIALQLRPDTRGRIGWLHAHGNVWVEPIVRDHLIDVLFDAGETAPPEPGDTGP